MNLEVDQSGRIETTNMDSVIGVSNSQTSTVRLSSREKRKLLANIGTVRPRWLGPRRLALIFAELIYISLKDFDLENDDLIVDLEYPGYEGEIKSWLIFRLGTNGLNPNSIQFSQIGKSSNAHAVAIKTFKKELKPNTELTAEGVLKGLTKKTGPLREG